MRTKLSNVANIVVIIQATVLVFAASQTYGQSSPFAGDTGESTSSRSLDWNDPTYEDSGVTVQSGAVAAARGARDNRGGTGLNRSLANELTSELPDGVTLIANEADAAFIAVGVQSRARGGVQRDADIDPEQQTELSEQIDPEQVREFGTRSDTANVSKSIVHFPVAFEGVPVSKFADVTAFVNDSGGVEVLRKRNLPSNLDSSSPTVTADEALAAARADAEGWGAEADATVPALEIWVEPDNSGSLSYRIELTDNAGDDPKARRYWISATDSADIIYWESMIHHGHNGQVTGTVWTESGSADGPTENSGVSSLTVQRSTGDATITASDGLYSFVDGSGVVTVSAALAGPNSVIDNFPGAEMDRSRSAKPSTPADLVFNATTVEELAQTTAFYWTNRAADLASTILDPTDLPALPTIVNRTGQCNAFWNGSSINFFQAGGGCPNMAYNSVVLHEYGHGVDARKGGILDGGYSEGFGDAMAILGTQDSCVGKDFFGPGSCLREASEVISWPLGSDGVHAQGRRYAGFVWELIQQLDHTYSEAEAYAIATQLVMGAAKANPSDIPDAVLLTFIVDDDDGNLANGTPNFKEIAAAADSRNLPRPPDPTQNVRRMGFAWASNPTSASYTPSTTYAFNSANMPVTATRTGAGQYAMSFAGLGGNGRPGANVQVTSYGSSANMCKVSSWSSGGTDFQANVRCFNPGGQPADDRYSILVTWP